LHTNIYKYIHTFIYTAIAAFFGTFIGLYAQKNENFENIMLSTTAGGFIYIATVNILPSILKEKSNLLQIFYEVIGFVLGVGFMVLVAVYEELNE
jgi:zinc transporter 7